MWQKLVENVNIGKFKWDISDDFQTLCIPKKIEISENLFRKQILLLKKHILVGC